MPAKKTRPKPGSLKPTVITFREDKTVMEKDRERRQQPVHQQKQQQHQPLQQYKQQQHHHISQHQEQLHQQQVHVQVQHQQHQHQEELRQRQHSIAQPNELAIMPASPLPLPQPQPQPRPRPLPLPLPRPHIGSTNAKHTGIPRGAGAGAGRGVGGIPTVAVQFANDSAQQEKIDPEDTLKLQTLGHGSSGKVYKVQHKKTGKIFALKVIQEKHELSVRKQILREMDILRRSSSPYVVSCYGAADKGGEISFVLEYMDGGSLANVLEARKTIPERYLSEVARQVLQGLDYLHRNKIIHRDIKPSNLLLNHKQQVKIADFGVSTVLASTLAPCSSFVGTCAYMSPERFDPDSHGGNYSGYPADIWSLGLTLLECAIGHFPFIGPTQKPDWPTLMFAICCGDPPQAPADASAEFKDFLKHCLAKDPALRPRASALLTHPFITNHDGSPCNISDLLKS